MNEIFKKHIETLANDFVNNHRFFKSNVSAETYGIFLKNVNFLISYTKPCLLAAEKKCAEIGDADLATFFFDKVAEEEGHDIWAVEDYEKTFQTKFERTDITDSLKGLTQWFFKLIDEDPAKYLGYILYSEYFTVLAGEPVIAKFQNKFSSQKFSANVIESHVELDKEHIKDDLVVIAEKITNRKLEPADLIAVINHAHQFIIGFYNELAQLERNHEPQLENR